MRLALVTNGLEYGGAERIVEILAKDALAAGHAVEVVATTRGGPIARALEAGGIGVHVLGIRSALDLAIPLRLARILARFRAEVVHSHIAVADLAALAAHLLYRRPALLTTVHSPYVGLHPLVRAAWQRGLARFDRVLATGERVRGQLPAGLAVEIVRPSLVSRSEASLSREEARRRLGVHLDTPLVLAIGRLVPVKGFDVLARAAPLLAVGGARVLLIGEGPERDALARLGGVELRGSLEDAGLLAAAADVVCVPSRSEGFPQVPLHAMAAGVPVVATWAGGTPEIVEHERTGLLVPPEDPPALARALDRLLADRALAARLGAAGGEALMTRGLTREAMLERMRAIYAELAGRGSPALHR